MKWLQKILMRKNEQVRKPYGYSDLDFIQDFEKSIDTIILEWKNYTIATSSTGKPIDEISEDQVYLNEDKKWTSFFVFVYGEINPEAKIYFPETTRLTEKWKHEIKLLFFSNLEPQKHILPHNGNNHHVIRTQIGIDIEMPEKTGLRVADKSIQLRNKEVFTFDDTYEHEAWNNSEKARTVLIIDSEKKNPHIYGYINKYLLNRFKKTDYVQSVIRKMKTENIC